MPNSKSGSSGYQVVDRLLALRDVLRTGHLTRAQIAEHLPEFYTDDESGARKLRRDLQYFKQWGYDVRRDKVQKTYRLSIKTIECDWETEELAALAALRESFKSGLPYADTIQAILKRIEDGLDDDAHKVFARKPPLTIELAVMEKQSPAAQVRRKLEEVCLKHQRVSFQYRPSDRADVINHPDEEPVALEFRDGHFYFVAHSLQMNQVYDYRVDQIVPGSVRILPSRMAGSRQRTLIDFQYRLSPKLAARGVSPRFPEIVAFDPQPDGSLIVTARGYNEFWIIREVLRYGEQAEIIAPDALRAKMRQVVEKMGSIYGLVTD